LLQRQPAKFEMAISPKTRQSNDYLNEMQSLDRNATGRSAWACASKNQNRDRYRHADQYRLWPSLRDARQASRKIREVPRATLRLAGQGPLRPSELQAHADPFHIAMTGRERLGATENEISPGRAGVAHATLQQRYMKAVAAE
jgi:hypothetical protein